LSMPPRGLKQKSSPSGALVVAATWMRFDFP